MNKKELILTKENILSFSLYQDIKIKNNIQNNFKQNEFAQIFNKLYDSNFLVIINELSSQIQSFYKSSNTQFNIMKEFFSKNENIKQISDMQNSFNSIELSFSQFYSAAKILFKKMKIYRNEKMKSFNLLSTSRPHKRSNTLLHDKTKNNMPLLLNLENIKTNLNRNIFNFNSGWDSERSQKNKNVLNGDVLSESNSYNSNNTNNTNINYNNSNNFSQSCNTTIDKEPNILLIEEKNQYSNLLLEHSDNLIKEIKALEETILPCEDNNKNNNNKMSSILNNIKKIGNSIKDNISAFNLNNDNQDKKIINDLSNKINLLNEENINIKKQFEKYRNKKKIKRKFFENQILNLSNKINDYEKTKKTTETKLKEMHNKYEEEISNQNSILNEDLKSKTEKIKTLEEDIINKDKQIISLKQKINDYRTKMAKGNNCTNDDVINKDEYDDIDKNKELNDKYNNNIKESEKEKEINDILIESEKEKKVNKELEKKEEFTNINPPKNENKILKNNNNDDNRRNNHCIDNNKISPDNYSIVKIYQYNNKLRWILFKKNKNINDSKYIRYNLGNNNIDKYNYNYNDFIWVAYKEEKDFSDFGDLSLFIEKEKDYDNIIIKLNQKNKACESYIEKLKNENYNLNNAILKYKSEMKEDKNIIGVSFIEEDSEISKFIDDKCCEDILIGLDKNKDNMNNNKNKDSCYNINLKNSIDMLMTKVIPSENVRSLICSILRQLGCSEEDIVKLVGKSRGSISIPMSINKNVNQ